MIKGLSKESKKYLKKLGNITLASTMLLNMFRTSMSVLAEEPEPRAFTVKQEGGKLSYVGDKSGNKLSFPKKRMSDGRWAYCLEHSKLTPNNQAYTEGGTLDNGVKYILEYEPNTGSLDKDYYIKQAALHYYLGEIKWIQYTTTGLDVRDRIVALSNEAKSKEAMKDTKSLSISASPRHQDFSVVGDNYETDWYNVSIQGNLTSYRMDIKGAPNGTQIINQSGQVVSTLTPADKRFKLRIPKSNVTGNYDIQMRLKGEFLENKAIEYIPSNAGYQKVVSLVNSPTDSYDKDILTAKLLSDGHVEVVKKSEDGSLLSGAGFKLMQGGADVRGVQNTDGNGRTVFSDLPQGAYELVETQAPTGHVITTPSKTITVNPGVTTSYEISNDIIKGRIKVLKVDEETGVPLEGAEFELREKESGKVVENMVTGADGTDTSNYHPFKDYVLKETKAPDKYTLNGQEHFVTISEHMQTIEVTAKNRIIKGKVAVEKSDSEIDGLQLQGVEFEISNEEGTVVDTLITNELGYSESKLLNYGKYTMVETEPREGYLPNPTVYAVEITEDGKVYTYDVKNDSIKGKIQIVKMNSVDVETPVPNATFGVYAKNVLGIAEGTLVDTVITDTDGFATTKDLRYGEYVVKETIAPEGYWLNETEYPVSIAEHGKVIVKHIKNDPIQAKMRVIKTDGTSKKAIEGVKFQIVDKKTGEVVVFKEAHGIIILPKKTFTTDKNGEFITPQPLKYGQYQLVEISAPAGYLLNGPIDFVIDADRPMEEIEVVGTYTTELVENQRIKGNMELLKVDEDTKEPLEGVTFQVTGVDGFMKDKTFEVLSGKDGIARITDLEYGKYRLDEVKTLEGYVLNTKPIFFDIQEDGKTISLEMSNRMIRGKVSILKVDDDKWLDRPLKGAEFTIFDKDNKVVDVLTTNIFGRAKSKDIFYGKYTMKETKAPQGYKPSDTVYDIVIDEDGQVLTYEIGNEVKKGKVEVIKVDKEEKEDLPLAGAEFTLYDLHRNPVDVLTTDMDGYAISKEIEYGKYIMQETKAPEGYIASEEIHEVTIDEDGKLITFTLENQVKKGKVEIVKLDSEEKENLPIKGAEFTIWDMHKNEVDVMTTDINGYAVSTELRYGKHVMKETKAPEGFLERETLYEITITEDGQVLTYTIENEVKRGRVEVQKVDSETKRVLEGVEFTIYDLHRNSVDVLTTNVDGYAVSTELRYGRYTMQETKALDGYKASDTIHEILIDEDGKMMTFDVENDVKTGEVDFSKTDVSTGEVLEGAHITITGTSETNDHVKVDFVSSKEGNRFAVPYGKYEIRETIAPDGYVLSEEVGTFEITEDGQIVKADLKNKRIEGTLEFEKTDVSTGEVIEGAHVEIECVEGFNKGEKIEFVSSKEGNKFELEYGKYTFKETIAPDGYILSEEVGTFEITEDGQIVKAELKNKKKPTGTLPQTGQGSMAIPVAIGSLLLLGSVWMLRKKKSVE